MTQLVLPNTIDAGTEIVASEHQQNYDAIKAVINGGIQGGATVDGNMLAKGVTSRELEAALMKYAGTSLGLKPGIETYTDLNITPGAGLQLNYASGRAFINDDGGVHTSGLLLPANVSAGGSVTIAANASGNPRIDQVIVTLTGYDAGSVSVLQGTASVGATLDNRTGAAALPANAIRLADILVPNGFAGPFVQFTHIRDRRPWAKPMTISVSAVTSLDVSVDSTTDKFVLIDWGIDLSGLASLRGFPENAVSTIYTLIQDGSVEFSTPAAAAVAATGAFNHNNGLILSQQPNSAVAGGVRSVGKAVLSFHSNSRLMRSDATVSSVTNSANHVVETQNLGNHVASSAGVGTLRLTASGGSTMTGSFLIERIGS